MGLGMRVRHCVTVMVVVLAMVRPPGAAASPPSALLGIYYGSMGFAMSDVQALEAWQGKRNAVINLYTKWDPNSHVVDNLFGLQLPSIWANGNVPSITWEPWTGKNTPGDIEVRVARGEYDGYVSMWASRLKAFLAGPDGVYGGTSTDDRRAYIRLGHEMNGNWYPWSAAAGGNLPGDYQAMWRRVHALFRAGQGIDANHARFVWAPNHVDVGGFRAEQFYPGDAYVDWIGVDGYNWGASQKWSSWQGPSQVFDPMVTRLRAISSRPLAVTEVGTSSVTATGSSLSAKAAWIGEFFTYALSRNVRMVAWFDEDKESDWAVFGGGGGDTTFTYGRAKYRGYTSYRDNARAGAMLPSTPANARLLTDEQFAGTWA